MKEINGYWAKCDRAGDVVKVVIKDHEAIKACNRNTMISWTVPQAVREFNAFLAHFGFQIAHVKRWLGDEYQ